MHRQICLRVPFKVNSRASIGLMAPDNDIATVVIFCHPRIMIIIMIKSTTITMMMIMVMLRIITIISTSTRLEGALKNVVMR